MLEQDEFTQIFDQMAAKLLGYIRTLVRDEQQAEDILQNVFIRLAQARAKQYPITNLNAFLFTLARNEAIREYNHQLPAALSLEYIPPHQDAEMPLELTHPKTLAPDEVLEIQEALLSLPEKQREIVYLKIYSGLTLDEIASMLSISINTVASRYRYAIEKLREILSE